MTALQKAKELGGEILSGASWDQAIMPNHKTAMELVQWCIANDKPFQGPYPDDKDKNGKYRVRIR